MMIPAVPFFRQVEFVLVILLALLQGSQVNPGDVIPPMAKQP